MEYTGYVLKSIDHNYLYTGLTSNLKNRFLRHNSGREKTTRPYRPFEIIFTETFSTRIEARQKEKYLKSGFGREFIKSLME